MRHPTARAARWERVSLYKRFVPADGSAALHPTVSPWPARFTINEGRGRRAKEMGVVGCRRLPSMLRLLPILFFAPRCGDVVWGKGGEGRGVEWRVGEIFVALAVDDAPGIGACVLLCLAQDVSGPGHMERVVENVWARLVFGRGGVGVQHGVPCARICSIFVRKCQMNWRFLEKSRWSVISLRVCARLWREGTGLVR